MLETFVDQGQVYLVMEELGDNLEELRRRCGGRLTMKCVLMVGVQLIERVEFVHSNGILHGDIKPSNVMIGKNNPF